MSTQTLRVSLPSEIIYVSGTVNGKAYTWTLVDGSWQAIVDRAADDTYAVALTAVNALGTSASYTLTLYYGMLNLITDRTQADVDRVRQLAQKGFGNMTAAEKTEWLSGLKGAYNASDLNRVGAAVAYVAGRLKGYGYAVSVSPRQDWQVLDIPTPESMTAYLADVAALRAALTVAADTPEVPEDMERLTWQEANDIEQILVDVDELLTRMAAAWFYSGDLYAGEV
nr:MAG TPA: hypothetical protein [Caudoviricetes sp.]